MATALCAAGRRQARLAGGGVDEVDGLVVTWTPLPDRNVNLTFVEREPVDAPSALEAAGRLCVDRGRPLFLDLEAGSHPLVERAAARRGLRPLATRPGMTLELSGFDPPPVPKLVTVNRVSTEEEVSALVEVESDGAGFDREMAGRLFPPTILAEPGLRAHLALWHDRPMAAALVHLDEGAAGVYWVATIPAARRRGFGGAVVGRALADASQAADFAWLQASRLGRPVYERLGFRASGDWTIWGPPSD